MSGIFVSPHQDWQRYNCTFCQTTTLIPFSEDWMFMKIDKFTNVRCTGSVSHYCFSALQVVSMCVCKTVEFHSDIISIKIRKHVT